MIDTDEFFRFSWAPAAIFALLVLDVSTEIGEYLRLVDHQFRAETRRREEARRAVLQSSTQAILLATIVFIASGVFVTLETQHMDWRMISILEGIARLEAAAILFFVSVKTPQWTGIYHSPTKTNPFIWSEVALQDPTSSQELVSDDADFSILKTHVLRDILKLFALVYFLLLPFAGHPLSFVTGVLIGLCIDACLFVARRSNTLKRKLWRTLSLAALTALLSATLFTSGCHYVQTVWDIRLWKSEWGLAVTAFVSWCAALALTHWCFWNDTRQHMVTHRRISTAAKRERLAMSLMFSVFDKKDQPGVNVGERQPLAMLSEEWSDEEEDYQSLPPSLTAGTMIENDWNSQAQQATTTTETTTTRFQKGWWGTSFTLWATTTVASLFIVIVNIGATRQMCVVRERFHSVHADLYGHMNEGPVCGLLLDSQQVKTFDSRELAHQAGYQIVHCGSCGHCSNWHNLRLEYTTRAELASTSAACGRKSMLEGRDAVQQCLQEEPIGFQPACAECWTNDIFCARKHCAFLFLQSTLINNMANFRVSENDITSATCEEAMCELEFVPCSGASRRRMNIKSGIERPFEEQCTIVDVDWEELFGNLNGTGQ